MAGTPEQVARGDYLVNLSCIGCHGAVGPDGNPSEQHPLSGGWNIAAAEGFGFVGDMVAENLTPGGKLANYSDGEFFRVLRHSIDKQGTKLGFMAFLPYKELSDDDTQAIIAYLRSLPARTAAHRRQPQLPGRGDVRRRHVWPPPAPVRQRRAAAGCNRRVWQVRGHLRRVPRLSRPGCDRHGGVGDGAGDAQPAAAGRHAGPGAVCRDDAQRRQADGAAFPETMPWQNAAKMTDDDLAALYAYLTAPVQ